MSLAQSASRSFLLLALISAPALAERTEYRHEILPGATLVQTILDDREKLGPNLVHALIVDTKAPGLRLKADLGGGTVEGPEGSRESVQRQVARTGALAGINADFFSFSNGDPLGLHIHRGELISEVARGRVAFGIRKDGSHVIGIPVFRGSVASPDGSEFTLGGFNRAPGDNELVALSPMYGVGKMIQPQTTALLQLIGDRIPVSGKVDARVVSLSDSLDVRVPGKHILLLGRGAASAWLKEHAREGIELRVLTSLTENNTSWADVEEAVAGGPYLLKDGKVYIDYETSGHGASFSTARHPRTAVGVTADKKVVLAVVDGRQLLSRGVSLPELAAVMKDLGATDAINLDGGGSSALSLRGLVLNSPSDGTVRRVSNALLVFNDAAPVTEKASSTAMAPGAVVVAGENPITLMGSEADLARSSRWIWGTDDGKAFVDQGGKVYGYKAGAAKVIAVSPEGDSRREWPVQISAGPPARITLTWKDGILGILLTDRNANGLSGREVTLTEFGGTTIRVTTGADGRATAPSGWPISKDSVVTARYAAIERTLPESASPVPVSNASPGQQP